MKLWQQHARLLFAGIGIASAIGVYAAMRHREPAVQLPAPERIDPTAIIESSGNIVQQVRGTKQDFLVRAEKQLTYEGGATRLVGVEVSVSNRGGRDFVIRADEAEAGERQQDLQLRGNVHLISSDGFELFTADASFSEATGQMRAPGAFTFKRRLMSGTGTGMTYDRTTDILSIVSSADIRLTDGEGVMITQFVAGSAVFNRPQHLVVLGNTVHLLHSQQTADARSATAQLNDDDSLVRRIELRGKAEVNGGAKSIDQLRGEAIDLEYSDDGLRLSRARLDGDAVVISPDEEGRDGRRILGRSLDLAMDEEGNLSKVTAGSGVQLVLPGGPGEASRTIEALQLDADGGPGGALSAARFNGDVIYREQGEDRSSRVVRSRSLRAAFMDENVESAVFAGAVRFQDDGLQASGAGITYAPKDGSLIIAGTDAGGGPRVSDEQIAIDASRIVVQIDSRDMTASGMVRTTLRPKSEPATGRRGGGRGAAALTATRLPGLFESSTAANGNAETFTYSGSQVTYTGGATLWQGDTAIRGDRISLDQDTGDLRVTGAARSVLNLASGQSQSRSTTLVYSDQARSITYDGDAETPAQVNGPDGDLRAGHIAVILEAASNTVSRLQASTAVTLKLDTRTATGSTLNYAAAEEKYVMSGTARAPVKIVEQCRETTGATLTFYKSADRIIIDGNEAARTQSVRGQQCTEPRR